MTLNMNLLAKRLRAARLDAGLTQENAGDLAGVSRSVIAKAELGITEPSLYTTASLANVYGVSIDWLLGLDIGETVIFFDTARQLKELTGLDYDGLWRNGFNLDDWDYGFVTTEEWDDPDKDSNANARYYQWHLPMLISNNCCDFTHKEWQGRHYYMRYHA